MTTASKVKASLFLVVNVVASLFIVMVNKLAFIAGFRYVCMLTVFHQISTALVSLLRPSTSKLAIEKAAYPITHTDALLYAVFFNMSIVTMNLSLKLNTLGTYQMLKLGVVPAVALLEFIFLAVKAHLLVYFALNMILQGSIIALQDDMHSVGITFQGLCAGLLAVFSTASQTVLMKALQKKCKDSQQRTLLRTISVYSSGMLLFVAPILDTTLNGVTYTEYVSDIVNLFTGRANIAMIQALVASCFIAAVLNASQFVIIGKFSPLTFQVLGQLKMVGVLLLGAIQLNEGIYVRKSVGVVVVIWASWSYASHKSSSRPQVEKSHSQYYMFAALGWVCVFAASNFQSVKIY